MNQTDILLEAGTNELEIMVLMISGVSFGVNVAKIREVLLPSRVHALPGQEDYIEGVIELRGRVVELMDLGAYLGMRQTADIDTESPTESQIVVTEFNNFVMAFRVDSVERIERASWDQVAPVPGGLSSTQVPVVGIATVGEQMIQLLDLEDILFRIKPELRMNADGVERKESRKRARILIAEDSELIRAKIKTMMLEAGFGEILDFRNGLDAWNHVESCGAEELPDLVVTDIEMPLLDGLHFCKRIRDRAATAELPVVLFSSLINERTQNKGEQVGATMQISKPQLQNLVAIADQLLGLGESA